jgi:hypothetical protein
MKFWLGKLESLCRDCHEHHHGRSRVEIGADGWPVDQGDNITLKQIGIEREEFDGDDADGRLV